MFKGFNESKVKRWNIGPDCKSNMEKSRSNIKYKSMAYNGVMFELFFAITILEQIYNQVKVEFKLT